MELRYTCCPRTWRRPRPRSRSTTKSGRWGLPVDYLVNNAGFGYRGFFHEQDWATNEAMIEVNILALARLTRLFVPDMIARHSGRVLNIGSMAGFLPGPLHAVYYASKAFVISFSEALANELAGTGVRVTVLCPGPTADRIHPNGPKCRMSGSLRRTASGPPGRRGRLRGHAQRQNRCRAGCAEQDHNSRPAAPISPPARHPHLAHSDGKTREEISRTILLQPSAGLEKPHFWSASPSHRGKNLREMQNTYLYG